jgi:pimeloyl-ACP methyl ester carboxylesterase
MPTRNTFRLVLGFTAIFILLETTSFAHMSAKSYPQINYGENAVQTKIDIGGYALYVNLAGAGSPAVIFEAGGGNTSSIWARVQPEISKITRTFSYDRAGLGKSDKRNLPNTTLTQVQELHTLLRKAEVREPYVFVANSYGAFIAKLFANTYPSEVAGIVYVDGTHEKLIEFLSNDLSPDQLSIFKKMAASNPDGSFEEVSISAEQIKEAGKKDELRKKPIIVLTSDIEITAKQFADTPLSPALSRWLNWQQDLAASSDKSKQYIIRGSGHIIHFDRPQIVINAIKKMIEYDLKGRPSPAYKAAEISPEKLRQFVGKYAYDADNVLTITEENGHLFADIPYLIQTEMVPISENEIITKDMEVAATIIKLTESGIVIRNRYSAEEKKAIKVLAAK